MDRDKFNDLWATVHHLYEQWDEGEIDDEEAVEKAAEACRQFLGQESER